MPQRSLTELLDWQEPMWPLIQQWLASAAYPIEVLPAAPEDAEIALQTLQVTTRSPLGTMAWNTGGIFVHHGWLRLLGAGGSRMHDSLLSWNGLGPQAVAPRLSGALLVGHDVLGGFFARNDGAFDGEEQTIFYFAPDTLQWEDLDYSYRDFLCGPSREIRQDFTSISFGLDGNKT